MATRALLATLLLLVGVACGNGDLPTQPTTANVPPPAPAPPPTPVISDIAGEYTLTLTASPSCSLPAAVSQRIYTATVAESTWGVSVALSGAEFLQGLDYFGGRRNGNVIDFDITFGMGSGMGEVIDDAKLLYYEGTAHATIAGRYIAGTLNGLISLYDDPSQLFLPSARRLDCAAADHRIEFVRR